ncbi:DUF7336 domain-containing protein [Pseudomonas multiresinivorans]|uniref:DUF7336 domain-containing protein n=1 Tax=Pseudomonas multiresinivorans TaxID=95301 RepID=UPI003B82FE78
MTEKRIMRSYLLSHWQYPDMETFKIIGIFSTQEKAEEAISNIKDDPGFRENPQGFVIDPYVTNQIHWVGGFGSE